MQKGLTKCVFILDRSGSMRGLEADTIRGFNSMLKEQKALDGECRITTVLFDTRFELLHDRLDIQAVPPVTGRQYFVQGATALLDAVGRTISSMVTVQQHTDPAYQAENTLFVIITDGSENASREYSVEKVRAMIEHAQSQYGWEFVFLSANIDAVKTAGRLGIRPDRAANYVPDGAGIIVNFQTVSECVCCFRRTGHFSAAPLQKIRDDMAQRGRDWKPEGAPKLPGGLMGAMVGDIVGSVYEGRRRNIKTKQFPFFREDCHYTDDTVMTIAVAEALMNGGTPEDFITAMKKYGRMYPHAGYGRQFRLWLFSGSEERPYNSRGNGSAMRVAPVGFFVAPGGDEAERAVDTLAESSAAVTHNHPEGIRGAQATANAILFLRRKRQAGLPLEDCQAALRTFITQKFGYDLSRTLDEIRPRYRYDVSCQGTVPQAITAFLESTDFEDAIRNAISLGGDSDTLAAITGGIAEAAYGVPQWIQDRAWAYLDEPLKAVCRRWPDPGPCTPRHEGQKLVREDGEAPDSQQEEMASGARSAHPSTPWKNEASSQEARRSETEPVPGANPGNQNRDFSNSVKNWLSKNAQEKGRASCLMRYFKRIYDMTLKIPPGGLPNVRGSRTKPCEPAPPKASEGLRTK